jgi:peptidoglycan/xylan/chitin deacetylase (PgdA/CDA1 family)
MNEVSDENNYEIVQFVPGTVMKIFSDRVELKVLMYHRIVTRDENHDENPFSIDEDEFRQQLKMLEHFNFTPITFEDFYLYQKNKLTLPKKPIILTFDDGLKGIYEIAFPLLREFNMRAVIFVMGDRSLHKANWYKSSDGEACSLITNDQILELREEGFEIGSHGMSHMPLAGMDTKLQVQEVRGSKESIENLLGEDIYTFSYPYGLFDEHSKKIVKKTGYQFACGVYTGPPKFGTNMYDIRRLAIKNNINFLSYLVRILTPYEYVEWIYRKFRTKRDKTGPEWLMTEKLKSAERNFDFS